MTRLENVWVYVDALAPAAVGITAQLARSVVVVKPPRFFSPVRRSRREHATSVSPLA